MSATAALPALDNTVSASASPLGKISLTEALVVFRWVRCTSASCKSSSLSAGCSPI